MTMPDFDVQLSPNYSEGRLGNSVRRITSTCRRLIFFDVVSVNWMSYTVKMRLMKSYMRGLVNQFKILGSIVIFNTVNMMDELSGGKRSIKHLLHDFSVKKLSPVLVISEIPMLSLGNTPSKCSVAGSTPLSGTKLSWLSAVNTFIHNTHFTMERKVIQAS